jgi:hypothetical protein
MTREAKAALAAVLLLALGLRVAFFTGLQVGDDVVYSRIALDRLEGRVQFGNIHETRLGFLLPIVASYAVFGPGEVPLVLYTLACSVGLAGVAFLLARRLFGDRAGAIAGVLAALHPTLVYYGTECHTDTPVAFWQVLAVLAALRDGRRPLALAGLLLGWAYLHKESALFVLPVILVARRGREAWALGAPLAGVMLLELLFYGLSEGDPLHRVRLVGYWHSGRYMAELYPTTSAVLDRLFLDLPRQLFTPHWGGRWQGTLNLAALAAGGWMLARRVQGSRLLAGWGAALFLLYCFWPSSWSPFRPGFALFEWTFPPLLVPLVLLLAGGLVRLRPVPAAAALVLVAGLSLATAQRARTEGRRFADGAREARARVGDARVVSDEKTREALDFLDGHRPRAGKGAVAVVDRFWTEPGRWWSRPRPSPPASWRKVYESERLEIYAP